MKVLHQLSLVALASSLITVTQTASAQRGRAERDDDVRRSRENTEYDGRWDDRNDRRRADDVRPGRRRGQDDDRLRRQRAQREEWCRRHRDDRRCDDFIRRGNSGNWCWDTNRDNRCDNVDNRQRDSRGVLRSGDRGPSWERWLRPNGLDLGATVPQLVPR
jgi:hypothetical protein